MSSNKQIKLLYFIVNIVFLVPFIISFFSIFGIVAAAVILGMGYAGLVANSKENKEAYSALTGILFMDTLICGSLIFLYFINSRSEVEYSVAELLANLDPIIATWIFLMICIYIVSVVIRNRSPFVFYMISLASLIVIGYMICTAICTLDGKFIMPEYVKGGAVVLNTYFIFSSIFVLCSFVVNFDKNKEFKLLALTLSFVVFWVVLISCYAGILTKAYEFEQGFGKLVNESLLWVKVVAVYATTLILCFSRYAKEMSKNKNSRIGLNVNILLFVANTALLYKFALSWYSGFNLFVVAAYALTVLMLLWGYYGEVRSKNRINISIDYDYDLTITGIIMFEAVLFILALWMFKHNMWINAIIIQVFTIILLLNGLSFDKKGGFYTFAFIFLQALALIFQFKLSIDNVIAATIIIIVSVIAYSVLNLKNPNNIKIARSLNIVLFALCCILNLALISRHGSKISVYPDERKVGVVVKALGKDNEVESALIYWTDSRGGKLTEEFEFSDQIESDIHGACMHIITTDSFGVVSKKTEWFPYWRYVSYE